MNKILRNKTLGIALAALTFSAGASAKSRVILEEGGHSGNGGDIIVCKQKAQFYDLYEAIQAGKKLELGTPATFPEALAQLMNRLHQLDPLRYESYNKDEFLNFQSDMQEIVQRVQAGELNLYKLNAQLKVTKLFPTLKDLPDEGIASFESDCEMQQLYIQLPTADAINGRAVFNVSLSSLLKIIHQPQDLASSVMHELIYRETARKKATTSRYARTLNELIETGPSRFEYVNAINAYNKQAGIHMQYAMTVRRANNVVAIDNLRELGYGIQIAKIETGGDFDPLGSLGDYDLQWLLIDQSGKPFASVASIIYPSPAGPNSKQFFGTLIEESGDGMKLRREGPEFDFSSLKIFKSILAKDQPALYIFDLNGSLRLVIDNQLHVLWTDAVGNVQDYSGRGRVYTKYTKIRHLTAAMEFDARHEIVDKGNQVDIEKFLNKLSAE